MESKIREIVNGLRNDVTHLETKINELEKLIKPTDDSIYISPMPMKLYCVRSCDPGEWLTNGKVYEVNRDGQITYDDGYTTEYDHNYYLDDLQLSDLLVPLVDRKAEKDEWIYITESGDDRAKVGEIYQFVEEDKTNTYIKHEEGFYNGTVNIYPSKYLVLDGYSEIVEPEPIYYTGKVICVDKEEWQDHWTVGKAYDIVDGVIYDNDGDSRPGIMSVEHLNDMHNMKFIEYQGGL